MHLKNDIILHLNVKHFHIPYIGEIYTAYILIFSRKDVLTLLIVMLFRINMMTHTLHCLRLLVHQPEISHY